ncbi:MULTISPECIES: hypothetical protein [unclassified Streptomyces]|uniref:hypothetical protein n=1 Tax=unclassified Streptomyces TaxID=2593676 RepID=UPI000746D68C|nr:MULTISPECIES: hypothetical protein [unclassified Streptomyces]KUL63393.1 hypothetical protein ADL30_03740 [Streptomyces sp. NRRL S-1521]THC54837.1 hypothetical protein E7X58_00350 [Streptomyces sp. A1499]
MKQLKRVTAALASVVLAGTALALSTAPVSAAQAEPAQRSSTMALPETSAVSPGVVGGGVAYRYTNDGTPTNCAQGALCLSVWDYSRNQWKVFSFVNCRVYNIANWEGEGYWENNQTPRGPSGPKGKFYTGANGTGSYDVTNAPYSYAKYTRGWTPINSVRPC